MNWLKRIFSATLGRRRSLYNDLSEELRQHLEEKTEQFISEGLSPKEAEQAARRAFGNPTLLEQRSREVWQWARLESLWADLKYALRQLRRTPGFATVAILSLALGIGATTSMFSLIYAVLLHPVPYADWERLVYPIYFNDDQPTPQERWFTLTWPQYQQLLKSNSIEDAVGDNDIASEITGHDVPESVTLTYITENVGSFLRVPPLLGRNLQPSDAEAANQQAPVVLSYDFWMRHFDGDRNVLNQVLEIDHKPYTIMGVMPRDYAWEPDLYAPMSLLPTRERNILPVMKLRSGVSPEAADAEIGALLHQFAKATPQQWHRKFQLHLERISDRILESGGHALGLLAAAVLMLLLIGCANCSILLLARGMTRQSELAVRSALGASRYRIVRQLLMEAFVLAITGSLLGIALAYWMARLIYGLFPDVFMHESLVRINIPVLAFSIALALVTGLLFGLIPSLRMSRPDVSQVLQTAGRKVAGRAGHARSLSTLIAAQIALTIVMMGAAGAAIAGFLRMTHRDLGYDPSHVMSVFIPLHRHSYLTREKRAAYFESLRQKIATVPGVTEVGVSTNATPPFYGRTVHEFQALGSPSPQRQLSREDFTDARYFSALRIPLLRGRLWDESENAHGAPLVVINQTFARQYFPQGNAIGQQIRFPDMQIRPEDAEYVVGVPDPEGWMQIIGIVGDSLNDGLDKSVLPTVYIPYLRLMETQTQFLVRTQGPPLAVLHSVQLAVASVNPDQQTERDVHDLQSWIEGQPEYQQQRLFSILFAVFSALALALALVGLYSVVSYSVAQRTNEFGIRMALGAQRSHVVWVVARNIGITVAAGLAAGLASFLALHKLLIHWTQNSDWSPLILAAVAALFLLAAALACTFPALRAASIDPMQALRAE